MTAPSSGRDDATLRGAVVLVVAIVIGLALLARSGGGGDDDESSTDQTTASTESTTTVAGEGETTVPIQGSSTTASTVPPGSTQDPASVLVVVLNATEQVGWAGENATTLGSAGYMTDDGNVAGENTDTTTIYATPEAQADAQAVADLLNLADAPVSEKPADPQGRNGEDAEADVVVVLGADSIAGGSTDSTDSTDSTTETTTG